MSERPFSQEAIIVAHRGASAEQPENTLAAFEAAVAAGAGAVEFDVRVTADGHGVVVHDATVDRMTDRSGLVRDLTLEQVRRLRIAGSEGVPTLLEALAALSGRVAVDIEIKNVPGEPDFEADRETAVELVHAALDDVAFVGDVLVSSFNPLSIAASKHLRPEVATGLLTGVEVGAEAAIRFTADQGHRWVLPYVGHVLDGGSDITDLAHEAGLLLGTWITDDPEVAVALFDAGVDAVATNDPRTIVHRLRSRA